MVPLAKARRVRHEIQGRVRNEIRDQLASWGIRRFHNELHRTYYDCALEDVVDCIPADSKAVMNRRKEAEPRLNQLQENHLPSNPPEAIKFILAAELEDVNNGELIELTLFKDLLDKNCVSPCQEKGANKGQLKRAFREYGPADYDPFTRFSTCHKSLVEHSMSIYMEWNDPMTLVGFHLEAVVACHLVFQQECFHCHGKDTLRWNGGSSHNTSSYADLVCLDCRSTYEIKSKKSKAAIKLILRHQGVQGGSWNGLFENPLLFCGGKRYLIVVSRKLTRKTDGLLSYSAAIAEIRQVCPRLSPSSFVEFNSRSGTVHKIKSWWQVNPQEITWLKIPGVENVDMLKLAHEAFDDKFGQGAWDSIHLGGTSSLDFWNQASEVEQDLENVVKRRTRAI